MKIAVLVKRVPDTASTFKIDDSQKSVVTENLKYVMSPYDEYAVEEAIRVKEAHDAEVVIVTLGVDKAKEIMRTALAMGADSGMLILYEHENLRGHGAAKVLSEALKTISPDLVFAGKQAVDDDAAQVPERVAEMMDMPHVSVISKFELNDGKATVTREVEGGNYVVETPLPALFSIDKGINTPRYPTLPNIMKAKKKEIKELQLSELGLSESDLQPQVQVEGMSLPRQDRLNKILEGDTQERVKQLLGHLREEEKVL